MTQSALTKEDEAFIIALMKVTGCTREQAERSRAEAKADFNDIVIEDKPVLKPQ